MSVIINNMDRPLMCPLIPARGMSAEVKQAIVDTIENTNWYHINRMGELVGGAESEETALYKAKDIYEAINKAEKKLNDQVTDEVSLGWYGEADGYADGELVYDMWYCGNCGAYFEEWDDKPTWDFCPICGEPMTENGRRKRR